MSHPVNPPPPTELRAALEELVLKDLLGPADGPEEEITGNVRDRYLIGMLAPRGQRSQPDPNEDLARSADEAPEDGPMDLQPAQAPTMFPSSFGLTCAIDGSAESVLVTARWGRYERTHSTTQTHPKTEAPLLVWKRVPMSATQEWPLVEGEHNQPAQAGDEHVRIRSITRRAGESWIVTFFLINTQQEPEQNRDAAWLFQPELVIEAPGGQPIFQQRSSALPPATSHSHDPEAQREEDGLAMRYREEVEFAVGHGVSVHADVDPANRTCAWRIATRVAPTYTVLATTGPDQDDFAALERLVVDMQRLSELPPGGFGAALLPLAEAYASWIERQHARAAGGADHLGPYAGESAADQRSFTAGDTLAACAAALGRMRDGIALLESDTQAADAFRFMNQAMWQQRIHTLAAEARRRGEALTLEEADQPKHRSWRPFQLAFILLNLAALTDPGHVDRRPDAGAVADLLWYPTGGGKTEAYLGLTAYTLGIRRLQGVVGGRSGLDGVAVIMRYTLRLLTLQQFQRATALICACEMIRRQADGRWGKTPFRIGLWVGQRTTPNNTTQSAEAIKKSHGQFQASAVGGSGSPAQLTNCPWCGEPIDPGKHIEVNMDRGRTLLYCGDPLGRCPFTRKHAPGEGLPAMVVDEEIYRHLPALLIATVDKFAQLPWNGRTQMLFGQVDGYCERHGFRSPDIDDERSHVKKGDLPAAKTIDCGPLRPPDLIIQDELHLISGPLGTLVGLYETVVDQLCTWSVDGRAVRPKVIASTATVRRSRRHVHNLFLRQVAVFPPPGLDAGDSFFAIQRPLSEQYPGRRYLGICATGKRQKAVLIRVYVAFLAAAQKLYEQDGYGKAVDPWMTLVGYFNAMRDLGGSRRLIDDDVRSRLARTDERGLAKRRRPILEELTSRKGSGDIPRILDRLETPFDPAVEAARDQALKAGKKPEQPPPLDVLLATNMISVGVDVKRLGLMVVSGQPKTTAEYIQASSRVGRSSPGLVCTIFNWSRPRDLSHYEQFEHYHATFYQQVEALSVTPFAPRALDRGLSALLVAAIRLGGAEFNANGRASGVRQDEPRARPVVEQAVRAITERAGLVMNSQAVADAIKEQLRERLDAWDQEARDQTGGRSLGYKPQRNGQTVGLLKAPQPEGWETFTCLNSLRDVEASITLILDDTNFTAGGSPPWAARPQAAAEDEA